MPSRSAIETALRHLAPRLPAHEFGAVVDHAMHSAGLRTASPATASIARSANSSWVTSSSVAPDCRQ